MTRTSFRELSQDLLNGIEDLERFAANIGDFVKWWTWMKLDTDTQCGRTLAQIETDYSSLRQKSVITKWEELQLQFVSYEVEV